MKLKFVEETPRKIQSYVVQYRVEIENVLTSDDVDHVVEIFRTPLTGAYNWNYTIQEDRIRKLYELGKTLNWNAEMDINWDRPLPEGDIPDLMNMNGYPPFEALSDEGKQEFYRHSHAWSLSQFLHGEQGALLVASQLASCAPTYNGKLYAASQAFDEARHVEVFNKYIQQRIGMMYPINTHLKSILDKILTDERWDLKFIGMQIIIEGLALSAFNAVKTYTPDPVLQDVLGLVIRDEARHVTFGVNYLEEFVKTLSDEEREERAMFAYEACVISRERLIATDVFRFYGWDVEESRKRALEGEIPVMFRHLLFTRVIPNLKRIGLLTDNVRPLFEDMGVLDLEDQPSDGDVDWAALEAPLELSSS
jgi:P-aminobenzoate N-oxygenase AurF